MQNHYNLLYREEEREMLPYCADQGVGVIPWSPLARGRLSRPAADQGTVRAGSDTIGQALYAGAESGDRAIIDALEQVAKARGLPMAQVGLAWLQHRGVTAPIVGATKPGHIEDAVASVDVELSTEELEALEASYVPHPVAGHAWRCPPGCRSHSRHRSA